MLDRTSIRWRLALTSAVLTGLILSAFAVVIGSVTASRVRSDFRNEMAAAVDGLSDRLFFEGKALDAEFRLRGPRLRDYAAPGDATIRILGRDGRILSETPDAPNFGILLPRSARVGGLRVETRRRPLPVRDSAILIPVVIQYGRKESDVEATVARVRLFLGGGVLAGTGLALLAGLMLGRRAMKPIAALTASARDIARTRDPSGSVPTPQADDEVAELARTLQDMLDALEASRCESEAMLVRQREFVADASHELRTPLTSILANLELLAEVLDGEQGEAAQSALRSSRRMRRLVGDLLLLARADAKRTGPLAPLDLAGGVVDAAAELEPVYGHHELIVDARPASVVGERDELHRLALNLMENALRHTPTGTHVRADVRPDADGAVLSVEDDGPGVPVELRERIFERFVRGDGERGSSSGLGLSIVRAVAESHGGSVTLQDAHPAARFVVRLPRALGEPDVSPSSPSASSAPRGLG